MRIRMSLWIVFQNWCKLWYETSSYSLSKFIYFLTSSSVRCFWTYSTMTWFRLYRAGQVRHQEMQWPEIALWIRIAAVDCLQDLSQSFNLTNSGMYAVRGVYQPRHSQYVSSMFVSRRCNSCCAARNELVSSTRYGFSISLNLTMSLVGEELFTQPVHMASTLVGRWLNRSNWNTELWSVRSTLLDHTSRVSKRPPIRQRRNLRRQPVVALTNTIKPSRRRTSETLR